MEYNKSFRFNYYIKNWKKTSVCISKYKIHKQNELFYFSINSYFSLIEKPFILDIPCLVLTDDGINNKGLPALVKVRYINDKNGGILCPFQYQRHWNSIKTLKDISWNKKMNNCVWRGATTGCKRTQFVDLYKDTYNVSISTNCSTSHNYVTNVLSIEEMLQYKYQISIEGNDKDTGLNWKLASNSIVLMCVPTIESWLMEGLLKPYVHYVPLKEDYSDLTDTIEWCKTHDQKCIEINNNAKQFMKQFEDIEIEKLIFEQIKTYYKDNITLLEYN